LPSQFEIDQEVMLQFERIISEHLSLPMSSFIFKDLLEGNPEKRKEFSELIIDLHRINFL